MTGREFDEEEKQNDKFIYKENESGYEVEFNGTKATGPTLMLAIIRAHRKYKYNNIIGENKV